MANPAETFARYVEAHGAEIEIKNDGRLTTVTAVNGGVLVAAVFAGPDGSFVGGAASVDGGGAGVEPSAERLVDVLDLPCCVASGTCRRR